IAVIYRILRQIRVKKIKADVTDFCTPDFCQHRPAREFHFDSDFRSVFSQHGRDRLVVEIGIGIGYLLISLVIYRLEKIPLAVEQPYADQWKAPVARSLAMVTGQNAQAARINRRTFMKPELEAEICHLILFTQSRFTPVEDALGMIGIVGRNNAIVMS